MRPVPTAAAPEQDAVTYPDPDVLHVQPRRSWEAIARYIQDQYHQYNKEESATARKRYIRDNRIHLCLYFVAPTDRGYVF